MRQQLSIPQRSDTARQSFRAARALLQATIDSLAGTNTKAYGEHPQTGMLVGNLGTALRDIGDTSGRDYLEQALVIQERHPATGQHTKKLCQVTLHQWPASACTS